MVPTSPDTYCVIASGGQDIEGRGGEGRGQNQRVPPIIVKCVSSLYFPSQVSVLFIVFFLEMDCRDIRIHPQCSGHARYNCHERALYFKSHFVFFLLHR